MSDLYREFTGDADLSDDGLLAVEMRYPDDKPRIRLKPVKPVAAMMWCRTHGSHFHGAGGDGRGVGGTVPTDDTCEWFGCVLVADE